MKKRLFTKWYVKYLLMLACIGILLVVPLLRPGDAGLIGTDSYLNLRLAQDLSLEDDLSFGGRFAAYSWGTPLLLSLAPEILIGILPFIFGILTFILFWLIIKELYDDKRIERLSLILLLLSPTFIYLFSFGNSLFAPIFLCILGFYLFMHNKWLCLPIVIILPLFNVVLLTCLILCMFFYAHYQKNENKKLFLISLIGGLTSSISYYLVLFIKSGLPNKIDLIEKSTFYFIQKFVYDFGSAYGIGLFLIALSIIGIVYVWKNKYSNKFIFFTVSSLIIFAFFRIEALLILNFFLCFFGSLGIVSFFKKKEKSLVITYTIIIILCGVVFSAISQFNSLIEADPSVGVVEGIEYLQSREKGTVFSDYSRGVWINYAGHQNFVDENYLFVDSAEERFEIMEEVYYSRDLEQVKAIFERYNIKYIWIDKEMKEEIWDYEGEGLLFILDYTRDFIKLYDKKGIEIYVWEELG